MIPQMILARTLACSFLIQQPAVPPAQNTGLPLPGIPKQILSSVTAVLAKYRELGKATDVSSLNISYVYGKEIEEQRAGLLSYIEFAEKAISSVNQKPSLLDSFNIYSSMEWIDGTTESLLSLPVPQEWRDRIRAIRKESGPLRVDLGKHFGASLLNADFILENCRSSKR